MNLYRLKAIVFLFLCLSLPLNAAEPVRTFESALSILEEAVMSGDHAMLSSLVNDQTGISIAGVTFNSSIFTNGNVRAEEFEFEIFKNGELSVLNDTASNFLWGQNGLFMSMEGVTISHYEIVDRDEIREDALIQRWEHGELETAVVIDSEDKYLVYILPGLNWRLTFERLDDHWYLTDIAARFD